MNTLDTTIANVTREGTRQSKLQALLNGLKLQVIDALGAAATPQVKTSLDVIFTRDTVKLDAINAALSKNVITN